MTRVQEKAVLKRAGQLLKEYTGKAFITDETHSDDKDNTVSCIAEEFNISIEDAEYLISDLYR